MEQSYQLCFAFCFRGQDPQHPWYSSQHLCFVAKIILCVRVWGIKLRLLAFQLPRQTKIQGPIVYFASTWRSTAIFTLKLIRLKWCLQKLGRKYLFLLIFFFEKTKWGAENSVGQKRINVHPPKKNFIGVLPVVCINPLTQMHQT